MARSGLEVADVLRDHGPAWRAANRGHISLEQMKVMSAIERCRSAACIGADTSSKAGTPSDRSRGRIAARSVPERGGRRVTLLTLPRGKLLFFAPRLSLFWSRVWVGVCGVKCKAGSLSCREISARRRKEVGYCNRRGQPFNPQSVRAMIEDRRRGSAGQATQIKGAS